MNLNQSNPKRLELEMIDNSLKFLDIQENEIVPSYGSKFYLKDLVFRLYDYYSSTQISQRVKGVIILPPILKEHEKDIQDFAILQAFIENLSFDFIDWLDSCAFCFKR